MAAYNRYQGNTGRVQRVEERTSENAVGRPQRQTITISGQDRHRERQKQSEPAPSSRPSSPPPGERRPPGPLSGLSGEMGRILGKISSLEFDREDLLLAAILYFLYRESGDTEFLIILAAMFFL